MSESQPRHGIKPTLRGAAFNSSTPTTLASSSITNKRQVARSAIVSGPASTKISKAVTMTSSAIMTPSLTTPQLNSRYSKKAKLATPLTVDSKTTASSLICSTKKVLSYDDEEKSSTRRAPSSCKQPMTNIKHTKASLNKLKFIANAINNKNAATAISLAKMGPKTRSSCREATGRTPPHKKFRKLRLCDEPYTPKTLFKKSSQVDQDDVLHTTAASISTTTNRDEETIAAPQTPQTQSTAVEIPVSHEPTLNNEMNFDSPPISQKINESNVLKDILSTINRTPKSTKRTVTMNAEAIDFNLALDFSANRSSSVCDLRSRSRQGMSSNMIGLDNKSPMMTNQMKGMSTSTSSCFRQPAAVSTKTSNSNLRMRLFDHNGNSPTWNDMNTNKMLKFDDADDESDDDELGSTSSRKIQPRETGANTHAVASSSASSAFVQRHYLSHHQRNLTQSLILSSSSTSLSSTSSISSTSSSLSCKLNAKSSPHSPYFPLDPSVKYQANINPFTPTNRYDHSSVTKNSFFANKTTTISSEQRLLFRKATTSAIKANHTLSTSLASTNCTEMSTPTGINNHTIVPCAHSNENILSSGGGIGSGSNSSARFEDYNQTAEQMQVEHNGSVAGDEDDAEARKRAEVMSHDLPKNKRLALRQCLVSRYHEEFHEVCKLGSGEFGDVFKCINRLDGCTYAIKRSKKPIAGSALEMSAWKEVCAHAVLVKHNHIVQYYSAWAEADRMLIQNEYCNGGSLLEFIESLRLNNSTITTSSGEHKDYSDEMNGISNMGNQRLTSLMMSEADLKVLLLHIAKGLAYMHSLNLVHLDIKPGNIFICRSPRRQCTTQVSASGDVPLVCNEESGIESEEMEDDEIFKSSTHAMAKAMANNSVFSESITYKIGDLGHVTSKSDPHVEEGDCRYLPNEVLQEQYDNLTKADVFALALTVHTCATLEELPKNGAEWHWIRQANLKEMPQCSDRFRKLLLQMIHPDATQRPSASTLVHHQCICPDANKSKAQLRKELNQEKFKNEMLKLQMKKYEEQIVNSINSTPITTHTAHVSSDVDRDRLTDLTKILSTKSTIQVASKFSRSHSSTFL